MYGINSMILSIQTHGLVMTGGTERGHDRLSDDGPARDGAGRPREPGRKTAS